jgi:hypothetical protein
VLAAGNGATEPGRIVWTLPPLAASESFTQQVIVQAT